LTRISKNADDLGFPWLMTLFVVTLTIAAIAAIWFLGAPYY